MFADSPRPTVFTPADGGPPVMVVPLTGDGGDDAMAAEGNGDTPEGSRHGVAPPQTPEQT